MGTGRCGSCFGAGTTTCPSCGGRRQTSRMKYNGEVDISPCLVCGGQGRVKCQFCGGSGSVQTLDRTPKGGPKTPKELGLQGRWICQTGTWYEFRGKDPNYEVIEGGPMGQTGQGTATRKGNAVKMSVKNVLIGQYEVELQKVNDKLHGVFSFFGVTAALDFIRS